MYLKEEWSEDKTKLFLVESGARTRGSRQKLKHRKLSEHQKTVFYWMGG